MADRDNAQPHETPRTPHDRRPQRASRCRAQPSANPLRRARSCSLAMASLRRRWTRSRSRRASAREHCFAASGTARHSRSRCWSPPNGDFQESFIRGPSPLGPGAPPCERVIAFGQALLSHLAAHGDLLLAAQTSGSPGKRFDTGPYGAYRAHVIAPHPRGRSRPRRRIHRRGAARPARRRGRPPPAARTRHDARRLAAGWESLARRVLTTPPPPNPSSPPRPLHERDETG